MIDRATEHPPTELAVSSITCYGLYTGGEKCRDPAAERSKVDTFIGTVSQLMFDTSAAVEAARIRASLESRSEMIGPYDVLIAGHARAIGLTLVSNNTAEFSRVPGLVIEDW